MIEQGAMKHFQTLTWHKVMRRAGIGLAAILGIAPFAHAGTYSIVDIEWYPSNSPGVGLNGGYINFGTGVHALDLMYGMHASASAPTTTANSMVTIPTVQGTWRWKIQWVGLPGEPAPDGVNASVEVGGSASLSVGASWFSGTTPGIGDGQLTDPFFEIVEQKAVADENNPQVNPPPVVVNGPQIITVGTGQFTFVSGTTWVGYVTEVVNDIASLSGSGAAIREIGKGGQVILGYESGGGATLSFDAFMRLTSVGGQTLQSNL